MQVVGEAVGEPVGATVVVIALSKHVLEHTTADAAFERISTRIAGSLPLFFPSRSGKTPTT